MTPRERLLKALGHKEPDRIPIDLGGFASNMQAKAQDELKNYLRIEGQTKIFVRQHAEPDEGLLQKFRVDTRYVRMVPINKTEIQPDNSYYDDFGIKHYKAPLSHYYDVVEYPLANALSVSDLRSYDWPDPSDPRRIAGLKEKAKDLYENTDYAVVADAPKLGVFEMAWLMVGFERFLVELSLDTNFARYLLEKMTEILIGFYNAFLNEVQDYIQVVMVSDDLGTQNSLIISPQMYRSSIKPYQKKLWRFIKEKSNAFLFLHSCGSIRKLIPDFIELGIDALNPVQVSATDMDSKSLKEEFGSQLTFWGGGCDTQRVLPFGTPQEVRDEVIRRINDLSPGGGFVFTQVHNIQPGTPPANVVTMFETALEYGYYNSGWRSHSS